MISSDTPITGSVATSSFPYTPTFDETMEQLVKRMDHLDERVGSQLALEVLITMLTSATDKIDRLEARVAELELEVLDIAP